MISMIEIAGLLGIALVGAAGCAHLVQRIAPSSDAVRAPSGARRPARWGEVDERFRYVRRPQRFQVSCPVEYETTQEAGRGCVTDMSRDGWRIQGKTALTVGTSLILHITLPGEQAPVIISEAVVRWVGPEEFGISLTALDPDSAARLSDFFRLLQAPLPVGYHAPAAA